MTTSAEQAPVKTSAYTFSVWNILPCFLWAALATGILAGWLGLRNLESSLPFVLGTSLVALGIFGLFMLGAARWFRTRKDASTKSEAENQLRPILALGALASGAVLLLLAIWLAVVEKQLLVLPEVLSLVIMGLIYVGIGVSVRLTEQSPLSRAVLLQSMLSTRQVLALVMMVLGVAIAGYGVLCIFNPYRFEYPALPEGIALVLIGATLFGGGLWLQLSLAQPSSVNAMRWLALCVGSLTGLILTVFSGVRFLLWSKEYFAATMRTWQGEGGWRFAVVAYIGLFGLVLLFGSLLLARVDIRNNVLMRRLLYGYNAFLIMALLLAELVVINLIVATVFTANVEWTESMGMQSLSTRSVDVLEKMKDKATVYVLIPRYGPNHLEVRDLLDNCLSVTNKLEVIELSPDINEDRYRELARTYPELGKQLQSGFQGRSGSGRGLLIVYGAATSGTKKQPHVFIPETDLEENSMERQKKQFKGELALMQAIQQLVEGGTNKPKIYFTQGNGELRLDNADFMGAVPVDRFSSEIGSGAADVAGRLRKDNYEVKGLVWGTPKPQPSEILVYSKKTAKDPHEVPEDCNVLVIAAAEKQFPKDVLEAIDRYMEKRNGKLMVLTNTGVSGETGKVIDDGMIEFCRKYNVQLTNDFVLRVPGSPQEHPVRVVATVVPATQNKVAAQFNKRKIYMHVPRSVTVMKGPSNYQADEILQIDEENNGPFWAEKDPIAELVDTRDYVIDLLRRQRLEARLSTKPVPVAAAVVNRDTKPRVMVIGDATLISSDVLQRSPTGSMGYDFFRSGLAWLSEREAGGLGISPRERGVYLPDSKSISTWRAVLMPLCLLALGLGGMGAGIWIVRRK